MYTVYILRCSDNTLYTGITNDIDKRLKMHSWELPGWAKYTRSRTPLTLIYTEKAENRSLATKREIEIKKLSRERKLELIDFQKA